MKKRIERCTVKYDSWQMQCCGDPIHVGQVVSLPCVKDKPYTCACGMTVDFHEEHHGGGANCLIRGKVTKIQSVFVDHFAHIKDGTRYVDDPDNTFAIIEVNYIEGWENPVCYGQRDGGDVCYYIITLENAIECVLASHDEFPSNKGREVTIEPSDDDDTIFWDNDNDRKIGTAYRLKIYKGWKSRTLDLTSYAWHEELLEWHKFFRDNIYAEEKLSNVEWLKWWSKGWGLMKEIRKLLPADIDLVYGNKGQAYRVLSPFCAELNTKSSFIYGLKNMQDRIEEGLYIPKAYVDCETNDDAHNNYAFRLDGFEHDLYPDDRVVLCVCGRRQYHVGTVRQCTADRLIIHTDWPLDITESYSIELIL